MVVALFGTTGYLEWLIVALVIYLLFSRGAARRAGQAVGSVKASMAPEREASEPPRAALYRTLEVPETATLEQVRESYKNLVKVWHPDRFPNDAKLREKANQKLQDINAAYEKLVALLEQKS